MSCCNGSSAGGLVTTNAAMCAACAAERNGVCRASGHAAASHFMGGAPCPRRRHADPAGVVRWLGLRWWGAPILVRWRLAVRAGMRRPRLPGCGCLAALRRRGGYVK